jgi:holo-[acyl-carrier protein] synthase
MILGIGTDLIEVGRIEKKIQTNDSFKHHVFSEKEIMYCENAKNPYPHFAARWAVKEAFLKAFGVQFIGNHKLPEIETSHDEHGKPLINLCGKMREAFMLKYQAKIHVTITHTKEHALAFVIIEQ